MLERYSLGTGDRFGQEGEAQLRAIKKAQQDFNTLITPVWNKSHREHEIIGTNPQDVRNEADQTVAALGWEGSYCVDADHITRDIVDGYIKYSDFFTIDVADYIGKPVKASRIDSFLQQNISLVGSLKIPGINKVFEVTEAFLRDWAEQYLAAILEAKEIYKKISSQKEGEVCYEISIDEVETSQTPIELYFILKTVAEQGIPIDTVAPKFTGDFLKGVDYIGNIDQFIQEFEQDILIISHVLNQYNLPDNLKLSIHSGSDKFSLYSHIYHLLEQYDAGVHLKTSGTTWLAELIGLAESGEEGLQMAKNIYHNAYQRFEELTAPYTTVVDIKREELPKPHKIDQLGGRDFTNKLEHQPENPEFDPQLRQLLHCSYKIAAEMGEEFINLLKQHDEIIGKRVTHNLFNRHICPLFLGVKGD